jgi:outer membrane immunogenic protein
MSRHISFLFIFLFLSLTDLVYGQDAFNWSGFYIGGNLGGNWAHYDAGASTDTVTTIEDTNPPFTQVLGVRSFDRSDTAFIGGGQAGYNFQFGIFVLGVEGDLEGMSGGGERTILTPHPTGIDFAARSFGRSWSASGGLRAGVTWKQFLLYATGGGAFTDVRMHVLDGEGGPAPGALPVGSSSDATVAGWTAGVGAEYAITKAISVALEYRHAGFGSESYTPPPGSAPILGSIGMGSNHFVFHATSVDLSENQLTLRVNFLFNGLLDR